MRYQCTECDKESTNYSDYKECLERRHTIDAFPESSDKPTPSNPKKTRMVKVKGWIDNNFVESIILDSKPAFLCYNRTTKTIKVQEQVENDSTIYVPPNMDEYGYTPYSLSRLEFETLSAKNATKEQLLDEIKEQVDKYISSTDIVKNLILGDLFFTYCQEWVSTTHYLFFVGETESGKSSALHLFRYLGYRCLYGVDIPKADVYSFLGTDEEATGIIAEDEAQEMAVNREKIRLYKNSYTRGSKQPIVVLLQNGRKQIFYNTFCFKLFAGERVPEDKAFQERLAVIHMIQGTTQGNVKRLDHLQQKALHGLRNKLLIWKVKSIEDTFSTIQTNLKRRDQELWEDFVRVFVGTKYESEAQKVVEYFTSQRQRKIHESLEARIFEVLHSELNSNYELYFEDFWKKIIARETMVTGHLDRETLIEDQSGKKITRTSLAKLFEEKFQAEKKIKYEKDNKYRKITYYVFNKDTLLILAKKYNTPIGLESPLIGGPSSTSGLDTIS